MKFQIITNYPIATDSPDHITPYGVKLNNSKNSNFNKLLYELFNYNNLNILDLGCAGGGFIHDCVQDGHNSLGIEGSNYAKLNKLGCWTLIPDNLQTTDISKPFIITNEKEEKVLFDVITAWDVLEHIKESDINTLIKNVLNHLSPQGCFICSINVASYIHALNIKDKDWGIGMHHQNIQDIDWWDRRFASFGLSNNQKKLNHFQGQFIRGPGCGCDEFATEERMKQPNLPIQYQWATIIRFLENKLLFAP